MEKEKKARSEVLISYLEFERQYLPKLHRERMSGEATEPEVVGGSILTSTERGRQPEGSKKGKKAG